MKILIVEDEPDMAEVISVALTMQWADCQVLVTAEGEEAIDLVEQEHPDVVLLDIALPGMDGYAVCSQLRAFSDVPVIMLTVRDAEADKVRGLELGADDYVTKPFSHLELLARIRAVLRRTRMPLPAPRVPDFVCGRLAMHFAQRQVTVDGKPLKLTPTEYNLLYHLVRNAGQVLPHSTLLAKVWGHEYKDELDYLKVYIRRLREKLEEDPKNPRYILTARGIGYRFVKT
ncbi:MAG: response regulator transcription factor [Chloroflexi bacterium]|nr:response regulator transcription factor [Chloroflexota bacterium]